jgi:hypothetical protein
MYFCSYYFFKFGISLSFYYFGNKFKVNFNNTVGGCTTVGSIRAICIEMARSCRSTDPRVGATNSLTNNLIKFPGLVTMAAHVYGDINTAPAAGNIKQPASSQRHGMGRILSRL